MNNVQQVVLVFYSFQTIKVLEDILKIIPNGTIYKILLGHSYY